MEKEKGWTRTQSCSKIYFTFLYWTYSVDIQYLFFVNSLCTCFRAVSPPGVHPFLFVLQLETISPYISHSPPITMQLIWYDMCNVHIPQVLFLKGPSKFFYIKLLKTYWWNCGGKMHYLLKRHIWMNGQIKMFLKT